MARRKISYVDANKALIENRNRREQSRLEAVQKLIDEHDNMRVMVENARDARAKNERNHSMLMEAARDDNLSKALKAIYITALDPNSLTEMNLAYADGMVDRYINERGGATNILNNIKGNTYFLSRLTQIVEDAAKVDVHNIENFDRDLEKEFNVEKSDPIPNMQNDVHNIDPVNKRDTSDLGAKEGSQHKPFDDNPIKNFDPNDNLKKTNEAAFDRAVYQGTTFVSEAQFDSLLEDASSAKKERKQIAKKIKDVVGQLLLDNGVECTLNAIYIGGNNAAFINGQSKTWLMAIQSKHHSVSFAVDSSGIASAQTNATNAKLDKETVKEVITFIKDNKNEIIKALEEELGLKVQDVKAAHGRMGVTNFSVTFADYPVPDDEPVEESDMTLDAGNGAEITISIKVNGQNQEAEDAENEEEVDADLEDGEADTDSEEVEGEVDSDDTDFSDGEEGAEEEQNVDDLNADGEGDLEDVPEDNGQDDTLEGEEEEPEEVEAKSPDRTEDEEEELEAGSEEEEPEEDEEYEGEEPEEDEEAEELEDDFDADEVIGQDADGSDLDNDDSIENPGEDHGQLFKDLEDEPDVKKAIEIIRDRISDAEETFIKNNAKDKEAINKLIDKISDNVKTVEDADKDSKEAKVAQENVNNFNRYRKDIQEGRPVMSIFEKITKELNKSMLKNRQVLESYLDEDNGHIDEGLVIESARVLYGWIETVNTLKIENVDEAFIEDLISQIA